MAPKVKLSSLWTGAATMLPEETYFEDIDRTADLNWRRFCTGSSSRRLQMVAGPGELPSRRVG